MDDYPGGKPPRLTTAGRTAVFALVVLVLAITFVAQRADNTPAPTEDSDGWDCATQGNRICGPEATR